MRNEESDSPKRKLRQAKLDDALAAVDVIKTSTVEGHQHRIKLLQDPAKLGDMSLQQLLIHLGEIKLRYWLIFIGALSAVFAAGVWVGKNVLK